MSPIALVTDLNCIPQKNTLQKKVVDKLCKSLFDGGSILHYTVYTDMINLQIGKITRNGTGLAVIIPKNILRALNIERGDNIVFSVAQGDILCMRKISDAEKLQIKPPVIHIT